MRAYLVAWRQWKEGEDGVAAAQLLILAGGGAMGEAMCPAKEHALLRRPLWFSAVRIGQTAACQPRIEDQPS